MQQYRPYNVYQPRRLNGPSPSRRSQGRSPLKKASLLGVIVFMIIVGIKIDTSQRAAAREAAEITKRQQSVAMLQKEINLVTASAPQVNFSLVVIDSKYGLVSARNQDTRLDAASTAKLLSAALYLSRSEKGISSLSKMIDGKSAKAQLREMVQKSNDTQWRNFNELLGHRALQRYADGLGLASYDAPTNTISANDMTKFLMKLNEGKLLSRNNQNLLLSFMKNTNYEDFISPAVAKQYSFYHKVGINEDQVNDVAIIGSPGNTLYISIFTNGNGTYNWPYRAELMQKITKLAIQTYLE